MKKLVSLLAVTLLMVSMFAFPVFAGGECGYAESDEEFCEIWWFDNETEHWCACTTHTDESGNYPVTFGPEAHEFADGRCTSCGRSEVEEVPQEDMKEDTEFEEFGESDELTDEEMAQLMEEEAKKQAEEDAKKKAEEEAAKQEAQEESEAAGEETGTTGVDKSEDSGNPLVIVGGIAAVAAVAGVVVVKKRK